MDKQASPLRTANIAVNHQPWSNAFTVYAARAPVSRMATRMATPNTEPSWRAIVTAADPVAKLGGGSALTAVLIRVGKVRPTPIPEMSIPGNMSK
jgi:hypothetical protein